MVVTACVGCGKVCSCGQFKHNSGDVARVCADCWERYENKYGQYPIHKTHASNTNGGKHIVRSTKPMT